MVQRTGQGRGILSVVFGLLLHSTSVPSAACLIPAPHLTSTIHHWSQNKLVCKKSANCIMSNEDTGGSNSRVTRRSGGRRSDGEGNAKNVAHSDRIANPNSRPMDGTSSMSVVGPDYMQVLRGELFGQQVALVLCGESHEDAIDVTRKDGYFLPKEGWVNSSKVEAIASMLSLLPNGKSEMFKVRVVKQKADISQKGAQHWAYEFVEDHYDDLVNEASTRIFLVFAPKGKKGHAFLLTFEIIEEDDTDEENHEEEQDDIKVANQVVRNFACSLLAAVREVCRCG